MATTCYFEETVTDKEDKSISLEVEFGRSSFYDGESLAYLRVGDAMLIMDEKQGREFCEKVGKLARYLGYQKP